jgi:16S rRNA (cytosine967-C5)-methyltransferase
VLAKAHAGAPETLVRGDYLRLWPHVHGTDGFFAAVWERR